MTSRLGGGAIRALALTVLATLGGCVALSPSKPIIDLATKYVAWSQAPGGTGPLCTLRSLGLGTAPAVQGGEKVQLALELSLVPGAQGAETRQSFYFAEDGKQVPLSLAAWRTERLKSSSLFPKAGVTKTGTFIFKGPAKAFGRALNAWRWEGGLFLSLQPAVGRDPILLSMLSPPSMAIDPLTACAEKAGR